MDVSGVADGGYQRMSAWSVAVGDGCCQGLPGVVSGCQWWVKTGDYGSLRV